MTIQTDFYQVSGFRAHSNGWFKQYDDKPMIRALASERSKDFRPGGSDAPLELVLGILPSGASYVLLSTEQMHSFTQKHRLSIPRRPWRSSDFLSLSPVYFRTEAELSSKLATYKQRPRNKNRRETEEPKDNSQANRGYVAGPISVHYRAYVEQQRMLYHLLAKLIMPEKFALSPPTWLAGVRVISIVFVQWSVDKRRRDERLQNPNLIEVGITDAHFPSFFDTLTGTTLHLKLKQAAKNPHSKLPNHSKVEEITKPELPQRLRTLFNHDAQKSGMPLIVLCHDEEMTRSILGRAGIDIDSFESGLSGLLPLNPTGDKMQRHSRSCSPQRGPGSAYRQDYSRPTESQDRGVQSSLRHGALRHPTAYVVDIQKMFYALMESKSPETPPETAKLLRIQTDTRTCGGDDSILQLRMWKSMAEGAAIDEQRSHRAESEAPCAELLPGPAPKQEARSDNDDDEDPNDLGECDPNDLESAPPTLARAIDDFSDDDW
ncbi:hypothetical protein M404DRAFT_1003660 [Pisolithus tinctorius Marx 270]|uniref:Uncharacterized protein n=1 Tax=Pisolithus tinctorius Marx 270 TaxID=870435 RepID=A0A0C3JT54_PISTI|nr:hypothetical protein M404DRAFT_1003660 [Pisolithus tinctorius Marx 270]